MLLVIPKQSNIKYYSGFISRFVFSSRKNKLAAIRRSLYNVMFIVSGTYIIQALLWREGRGAYYNLAKRQRFKTHFFLIR